MVATTEFGSAIRTKSFIVGLLLLPVIMGASILLQVFVAERVDTKPRKFVVIDQSGCSLSRHRAGRPGIQRQASRRPGQGRRGPGWSRSRRRPRPALAIRRLALELSDRIHRGELDAYVEIPAGRDRTGGCRRDGQPPWSTIPTTPTTTSSATG